MKMQPLRSELRGDVLYLTLDTPGGAVNVFTRDAAANMRDILGTVSPSSTRAVVLRSGKPRSFLNGVGLLMAGSAKGADEAVGMARPVREAYRALRDCPVPTIAAIDGNCYGCGVELVLQCKYRVAADRYDTHFFMTEIADYLFIPIFGATQNLPRLLGLETAVDFVMWARRLSAKQALESGLIDRRFDVATFEIDVDRFAETVAAGGRNAPKPRAIAGVASPADRERVGTINRDRIRRLPPAYRELYLRCLALMESAAAKTEVTDADYDREAHEAGLSIVMAPCRAAWPFFFQRQMARALAVSGAPSARVRGVAFTSDEVRFDELALDLSQRCAPAPLPAPKGALKSTSAESVAPLALRLRRYVDVSHPDAVPLEAGRVAVSDGVSGEPFNGRSGVVLHVPLRAAGIAVAEVAFAGTAASSTEQALSSALADGYFTVLRTRPQRFFVLDEMLSAWLTPQVAYLQSGGTPADLASSLRTFGFARLSGDWIGKVDLEALSKLVRRRLPRLSDPTGALRALPRTDSDDRRHDPAALSAVLASLGGLASRLLHERAVPHAVFVDVAARELIDFPLQYTSLCRYFTVSRAHELIRARATFESMVALEDMTALEEFVAKGREYYVGISSASREHVAPGLGRS